MTPAEATKPISLRVSMTAYDAFEAEAKRREITKRELLEKLIKEMVKEQG